MSTSPTFITIPPEVRIIIYQCILDSHMPEADDFCPQPAHSLYLAGTSPFTWDAPDPSAKTYYGPWALLHVCKLVRRELQPLLDDAEAGAQLVYEFQGFSVQDLRAWATAAGAARVAAMRRWSFDVVVDCTRGDMGIVSDESVSESESEGKRADLDLLLERMTRLHEHRKDGDDEEDEGDEEDERDERDAEDEDGEESGDWYEEFGSFEKFHVATFLIDLNRLSPGHAEEAGGYSNSDTADRVHEIYWGKGWYDDRCYGCKDQAYQSSHWFMRDELLQGDGRLRAITGKFLCSMLDKLAQGARNSKARRKDWAIFRHRAQEIGILD